MTNHPRSFRWIAQTALGGAVALCALSVLSVVSKSWGQAQAPTATAEKGAAPAARSAFDAAQARDTVEVLEAQLEAKRLLVRIDDSRAEQAKKWRVYYERLVREGSVLAGRLHAAKEEDLMLAAHAAVGDAELKVAEIRVKYARKRADQPSNAADAAAQAREEVGALEAVFSAKQALLRASESRAAQSRQTEAHYRQLFRDRMATEDMLISAQDDVLLMDAGLAWSQADVKLAESRVKKARRDAEGGGQSADGSGTGLTLLDQRLIQTEMKVAVLQHEVGRLRRAIPRETPGNR